MIVLETPRLYLRKLRWDDLDDLVALYSDPEVMSYISGTPYQRQETQAHLQRYLEMEQQYGFGLWATIYRENGRFIGRCGLIPQEIEGVVEVEIGYMLAKAYWQRGLATEAALAIRNYGFQRLGCSRLISLIDPQNQPSMRVAAKIGLRYKKEIYKWNRRIFLFSIPASDRLDRMQSLI
jgi:ribosomal-protein-alanine N-acetyltransferase